jgi:hypothetical protein
MHLWGSYAIHAAVAIGSACTVHIAHVHARHAVSANMITNVIQDASAVVMHVRLQQIGGVYAKLVGKQLARQANILPETGAAPNDVDDVDSILDSIEKETGSSSIVNNGASTDGNDDTSNSTNERAPRPLPQQSSNEPPRRVRFVGEVGGRGYRSGGGGGGGHRGRAV